jgi:hypothetical protein
MTVTEYFDKEMVKIGNGELDEIAVSIYQIPELIRKLSLHLEKIVNTLEVKKCTVL